MGFGGLSLSFSQVWILIFVCNDLVYVGGMTLSPFDVYVLS
jgi:hypothetical protein